MKREPQDDELLRSYLLGDLPEEDADRLERRLLAEDDLFELAEAVEADLLAALDRGELTAAEGERVLRKLASSSLGQERLALARSLNAAAAETTADRTVVPFPRRAPIFPPPAIHWMALAASLVMLTGLGWFAWQHREQAPRAAARVAVQTPAPTPAPAPPPTPSPANPPATQAPRPGPSHSVPRKEPRQLVPAAVMTLSLMATRGAEAAHEHLHLSPTTETASIQIDAEDLDETNSFSVVIRKGEETVWQQSGLKVSRLKWGPALVAKVPARLLAPGQYVVGVTPVGEQEMTQVFDVVRRTI